MDHTVQAYTLPLFYVLHKDEIGGILRNVVIFRI